MIEPPRLATGLTAAVAVLLVAACVIALLVNPDTFDLYQFQFESAVTNTLLPLFEAMLTGLVAYVVGRELAAALRRTGTPS